MSAFIDVCADGEFTGTFHAYMRASTNPGNPGLSAASGYPGTRSVGLFSLKLDVLARALRVRQI